MNGNRARLRRRAARPVAAPFLPITSVLRKIGTALVDHFGAPAAPECPRAHESHSAQFAGVGATWPGHEAGNLPILCVSHASDHLIGIAALLDADNVVMACLSLVRPTLESLATAYYLLDPACDERERVRRWANMQLTSYVERLNINGDDTAAARQLQQLLDAGRQHGWVPVRPKRARAGRTASAWFDQPPRSGQALVGDLLDELGPGAGALLHRASSGVLHGQVHGLHLLLRSDGALAAEDPRDVLIAAGLSVLDVVQWTAPLLWGIGRLLERANAYYGWSPGLLERDLLRAQAQWVAWLRQGETGGAQQSGSCR